MRCYRHEAVMIPPSDCGDCDRITHGRNVSADHTTEIQMALDATGRHDLIEADGADRDGSERPAPRTERVIGGLLALDRARAQRIALALETLDHVESNPVGWGGDMAASLARSIRAVLTASSPADAGTSQSAPAPSQAAKEAHGDDERVGKYVRAIATYDWEVEPASAIASRVMAVADAEQEELRARVARVESFRAWLADEANQSHTRATKKGRIVLDVLADVALNLDAVLATPTPDTERTNAIRDQIDQEAQS